MTLQQWLEIQEQYPIVVLSPETCLDLSEAFRVIGEKL